MTTPSSRRKRCLTLLRVGVAPLLLGAVVWFTGPGNMLATVRDADWNWLGVGLLSSLAANLVSALRWRHLVGWLGHRVSVRWTLAVTFRALAVGSVLPGSTVGGDLLRIWHLHHHGCPGAKASTSVVLDRLSGLWMLWALGAAGLAVGTSVQGLTPLQRLLPIPPGWPLMPLTVTVLAVLLLLPLVALLAWRASRKGSQRFASSLHQAGSLRTYALQAVVSLLVQVFSVLAFACSARAFGVALPLWLIAVTAAPIFLLASLPISFGGWGTRELATAAAWGAFGVAAPQAVSTSIAFGVFALVQAGLGVLPVPASPHLPVDGGEAVPATPAKP